MYHVSNGDFDLIKKVLELFSSEKGTDLKDFNLRRRSKLLLRKFKDKQPDNTKPS